MKTTLLALAAAAMPVVMAGTPMYTVTEPANPYSLELAAAYNFAARNVVRLGDVNGPKIDTIGVDLTGAYQVTDNSSFNLRFGFATGSDSKTYGGYYKTDLRVNNFYLMPGYRYTHSMGERLSSFLGFNVGVMNESLKAKATDYDFAYDNTVRGHGSKYGFAYSAEVGFIYKMSTHFDVFLAYQFMGSTARPQIGHGENAVRGRSQLYHSVRLGMALDF